MAARARKVEPTDDWKDKIKASMLLNRLVDHSTGKVDLSPTQVKSIEVILDRITPKLSAVEQTLVDQRDSLSEDQVLAELQGLFAAKPHLLDKLLSLRQALEVSGEATKAIDTASKRLDITTDMQHS